MGCISLPTSLDALSLVLGSDLRLKRSLSGEYWAGSGVALFQVLLLLQAHSFAEPLLIGQETGEPKLQGSRKLHATKQQMRATAHITEPNQLQGSEFLAKPTMMTTDGSLVRLGMSFICCLHDMLYYHKPAY